MTRVQFPAAEFVVSRVVSCGAERGAGVRALPGSSIRRKNPRTQFSSSRAGFVLPRTLDQRSQINNLSHTATLLARAQCVILRRSWELLVTRGYFSWARGVVVSHPLSMWEALGSVPSAPTHCAPGALRFLARPRPDGCCSAPRRRDSRKCRLLISASL
jgi:hypothetical protein